MTLVAGVDFGTQSVRVAIVDHALGPVGHAVAEYPVNRRSSDPDFATQSHAAHMEALAIATRAALVDGGVRGEQVAAIALDTTGSTVVPVGEGLEPLDDYYLWCDHRAKDEAQRITEVAHELGLPAIEYCGGVYSSEWGFAKLLHWLRYNASRRGELVTALEHCDMLAATLCGITDPRSVPRSVCAMGHKWLWNEALGGLPPDEFLTAVDPLFSGIRAKLRGRYATSDAIAGRLCESWASRLGLRAGIPVPVGAFDAHWDAIGAGIAAGDVVNVVGTSTCIMAIAQTAACIPGLCGVVQGSIHPTCAGIEAGLSATGDVFDAIARRSGSSIGALTDAVRDHRAGQTGLLRMTWDNGDRTVLVNPRLGGVTLGWTLGTTAADELFSAIEGTAFHTRIIFDRMAEHGVPIDRVINAGGIPQKNEVLNRVYANVLGKPVLVPERPSTSLGAAIFAFMACGAFQTIEDAQRALCPPYRVVEPDPASVSVYERLYGLYRSLYFVLGVPDGRAVALGQVLPELRELSVAARQAP
jgi:L-ribulokinase